MSTSLEKYDFIIVGSGMGGLTSSVILAKHGYKVLVLEKNHQIGGALQVFSRDKCVFDTGVHYVGGLDKGENLYRLFNYLEIYDSLKIKSLDRDCFDMIRFADGSTFKHGQGYENFKNELVLAFPNEEKAIEKFCAKIKEICDFFPMYNLNEHVSNSYYDNPDVLAIGAWDYVCSLTENDRLKNVLLGSGPLYAGEIKSTPLYVVALIMNSYIDERYDVATSTESAMDYLVDLKHEFNDWQLAVLAFCTSPTNVLQHIYKAENGKTYAGIECDLSPSEKRFINELTAASYLFSFYKEKDINIKVKYYYKPYLADTIDIFRKMSFQHIAAKTGIDQTDLHLLNPIYKLETVPYNEAPHSLLIPIGYKTKFDSLLQNYPNLEAMRP